MRLLPRFVYRAPLLPVGGKLKGAMAELALALSKPAPAARERYQRRASFRATPHALWAGVGMGELGARTRARTGAMRASLTVAYESLWQAAMARLDGAGRVRVAPSLVRDETTARWLAYGEDVASVERSAEIDAPLGRVLDGARDWIAVDALAAAAGVDDEFVRLLVADGLLVHDGAPPLVGPPPLQWMAARHADFAEVARALELATPKSLTAVEHPLHAVLVHEGEVTLSRAAVERAAAVAPLLFRLQQALAPPMAEAARRPLAAVEELYGTGAYALDALALGRLGLPLDDEPPPPIHLAVAHALVDAIAGGGRVVELDGAALDRIAPPLLTPPTFELLLTPAREPRGAPPGTGWLVGLHAPAGATWGRFAHALGAPLVEAMRPLATEHTVDVAYAPSPRLGDLTAHPPLRARTLAISDWPVAHSVAPAELALGTDGALQAGETPAVPSPLWRVRSTTAPPGLYRLLVGHALVRQHAPWALTLGPFADLPFVPRLVLDGFVVSPASWRVPPLRDRAALRRWRKQADVPRFVQAGHEDELLLLDLDDRAALRELSQFPRCYEIWPPLDETIDAGGRRIEAVVAVIADERAPSPLPLVHPEPARDWHTWKLFGAPDRADRVLRDVVAPVIEGAGAWFFLRYVDGPGRRDHLRLRIHAADAAPWESRLVAALAPARARGDVVAVERVEYFRELGRWGADAIDAVERVFESDSRLVLALLDEGDDTIELLVASYDALAAGAGLYPAERHALAARRRQAYGVAAGRNSDEARALADEYRARQRALRARLESPSPPFIAHTERVAVALAPLPRARRADLLPSLLHLAAVRLAGVDRELEAATFYFWERTRESLLRHAER